MTALLLGLLLAACTGRDGDTGPSSDDGGSSGDACPEDAEFFQVVQVDTTPVGSVFQVAWTTAEPVAVRAVYEFGEGEQATPWSVVAQSGKTLVLGIPYNTPVTLRLQAERDGVHVCSPPQSVTTGPLDPNLPETTITAADGGLSSGGFIPVTVLSELHSFAVILDTQGRFVWFREGVHGPRVRLSRDRKALLYNQQPHSWSDNGHLVREPLAGEAPVRFEVAGAHTDFVELPNGVLATLGVDMRTFENGTRRILGDTIVEVDVDGTSKVIWSVFDDYEPDLGMVYPTGPLDDGLSPPLEDWSHLNGLSYDEASGDYVISAPFLHGVIRVDRATGERIWTLTEQDNLTDFDVLSDVAELSSPHSAELIADDRVLVFSRGSYEMPKDALCAWVTELELDEVLGTATPLWHWSSDDCVTVAWYGMAQRLPDGHTQTIWSSAGRITETDATGALVWQLDLRLGSAFGFGERVESLY